MNVYYIGTVLQWVALVAALVWIAGGIYQITEIRMRKKVAREYKGTMKAFRDKYLGGDK